MTRFGLVVALVALGAGAPVGAAETTVPEQLIDALQGVFGTHPGQRRAHPKGFCASGEFVPTAEAKRLSVSPLFAGGRVPAVIRLSIAGGSPAAPDASRSARGLAVQFQLPGGAVVNTATLNAPVFAARDPETFRDLLRTVAPDPATGKTDAARVAAFRDAHPDTKVQPEWFKNNPPPWSYATARYYSIHTFYLTAADGTRRPVRWQFEPEDGERGLSAEEIAAAPPTFLQQRLVDRVKQGPVKWRMIATLGEPGDPTDDPTQVWPAGRKTQPLGVLTLSAAEAADGGVCDKINFDPNVLSRGIEASNDPVLRARSPAYAISYGKRLAGQ